MRDESMDCSCVANETGRKRQFADKDGFEKPWKPAKLKVESKGESTDTSNIFEHLREDAAKLGTSKEATPSVQPKPKRIPHIVTKVKKVKTAFINAVRAQTSGLVSFEYIQGGLKIRTLVEVDHKAIVTILCNWGWNSSPLTLILFIR